MDGIWRWTSHPRPSLSRVASFMSYLLADFAIIVVTGRTFPPKPVGDGVHVPPSGTGVRQQRGTLTDDRTGTLIRCLRRDRRWLRRLTGPFFGKAAASRVDHPNWRCALTAPKD